MEIDRDRDGERDTERERERYIQRQREAERDRETFCLNNSCMCIIFVVQCVRFFTRNTIPWDGKTWTSQVGS